MFTTTYLYYKLLLLTIDIIYFYKFDMVFKEYKINGI